MRSAFAVWVLAALLSVGSASGQERRGRVHRIEIFNGATRTVSYTATGLSSADAQSLRELQRLENESGHLDALNREYAASERRALTALDHADTALGLAMNPAFLAFGGYPTYGNLAFGGYGPYPSYPAAYRYGGFTPFPATMTADRDDGATRASMARAIAQQAERAQAAARDYDRAAARAAASPDLRAALNLPARADGVRPVAGEEDLPITLTLKNGDQVRGLKYEEKGAWFVVTLPGDRELRLRESEVTRIEKAPNPNK